MGGVLQRIEVLLVGLVILIAGAVVALLMVLRPPTPAAYVHSTPQPVVTAVAAQPTGDLTSPQGAIGTPPPTVAPVTTSAAVEPEELEREAAPERANTPREAFTISPIASAIWPWLLVVAGLGVGLVARRIRAQRPIPSLALRTCGSCRSWPRKGC
jgi:hypothetical protein